MSSRLEASLIYGFGQSLPWKLEKLANLNLDLSKKLLSWRAPVPVAAREQDRGTEATVLKQAQSSVLESQLVPPPPPLLETAAAKRAAFAAASPSAPSSTSR